MNFIYGTLSLSAPILLASTGALISEYSGCMALFLDGIINLSAFLCFTGTLLFHSAGAGTAFSLCCCMTFILLAAVLVEKLHANRFLASLALNLLSSALTSFFSSLFFNTRGVLTDSAFIFPAAKVRLITTAAGLVLCVAGFLVLRYTRLGLYIRIAGSDAPVLRAKGVSVTAIHLCAWTLAALFGGAAGCTLGLRLSSFVPNIASGIGWTALAVVFLGKKNAAAITAATIVFSLTQYCANNIQNFALFKSVPAAFLLSLPYWSALLLILLIPQKRQ